MKIIGVDPAPKNGLSTYNGEEYKNFDVSESREYINRQRQENNLLICWDAPLTGPSKTESNSEPDESGFSQRPIEAFFSRKEYKKTPAGISVQPYSGCPHWTITRGLVGLPRLGPWDMPESELPFQLVTSDPPPAEEGQYIVEIHPAVAIWLWLKPLHSSEKNPWKYKKDDGILENIQSKLYFFLKKEHGQSIAKHIFDGKKKITDDDEIDARVAFILGKLWVENNNGVAILGDRKRGAFLLPKVEGLQEEWDGFER